ncbi:MAG: UDP-glucose 4-epimerase GalE [Verrucomicrobia bacterium]|nr:UDP-glucose 4-epimerase GalE [Verrucomicrobiota bacterium]
MKVLVTGGAGYIGSACVEHLIQEGHQVIVYDNLSEGHRDAIHPDAHFIHNDLASSIDLHGCFQKHNPEAVIHVAASALVGESMANPSKYFTNNVANAVNLLDAAVNHGIKKFVFSSTCATYGIPESLPMAESLPQLPINPYGESKLMFEKILLWYQKIHNVEPVIFRYFNAAGATPERGEHHRIETHLIPNILKVALGQSSECMIFGTDYDTQDGTCIRDYIHISDLAQAHIKALNPGIQGAFNLGNGGGYSVRQVVNACIEVTQRPIKIVELPRREGDPPILVANASKASNILRWSPGLTSIHSIISSAWDWHLKHPHGYLD